MAEGEGALAPYKVLDLTQDQAMFCGKVLAELGAQVVKVEPPGGDECRRSGPFYHDIPDPEKSLPWLAYNVNKKGITLNISSGDGRRILEQLLSSTDILIESFAPGYLEGLRLGYAALSGLNPKLIMVSITPFGQTGPYRAYKGGDLVTMALSGYLYLNGHPDRPPVQMGFPQAFLHAAADGATGAMMAIRARRRTGHGQHVDVSAQESCIGLMQMARVGWETTRTYWRRQGSKRLLGMAHVVQRSIWRCLDGYVSFTLYGGADYARANRALAEWIRADGLSNEWLDAVRWEELDLATVTQEFLDRASEPIDKFFGAHTKDYLYEGAVERGVLLYPVANMNDILESRQLAAREWWAQVEHPELGVSLRYPGPFVKASETPLRVDRRAPLVGEHNIEIYEQQLGMSRRDLVALEQAGVI